MTHAIDWRGLPEEYFDWMKKASGVRQGVFDISFHAVDWYKVYTPKVIPEVDRFRNVMFDSRNALAIAEIPGKVFTALESTKSFGRHPSLGRGYRSLIDLAGVVGPIADASEFWNARIAPINSAALSQLRVLDAATLAITMTDSAGSDIGRIWRAVKVLIPSVQQAEDSLLCRDEEDLPDDPTIYNPTPRQIDRAWDVLALSLIDLAKSLSYIALGALALVSTFYGAIAYGSLWILAASTSALVFSILGEFSQRAVRSSNPHYPDLPDVLREDNLGPGVMAVNGFVLGQDGADNHGLVDPGNSIDTVDDDMFTDD